MTMQKWLEQWNLTLPSSSVEACRLQVADGPELVLEKMQGGWLMAMRLGALSHPLPQGVLLQLLQVNSPFSPLYPVRLTADGTGELVLWVEAQEGQVDVPALNEWYGKLCQGYAVISP
ncbi:CesT family type III secretion system chaperone [Pseudomonas sp. SWRI79]|uniref:CesT family type III secretion system chaperone n=1 Tax=Pseudomonas farris TaxID=2841207 RepID=A0ABS6Q022_9PSED|nr:CesT family type III secretion system chaperone [Pseudomonas farris]MBV4465844.1 CesT family type III secretion system chaperone [Pseudomonas farris]